MPTDPYPYLDKTVVVSYDSLRRYLPDFDVPPEAIQLPHSDNLSVEVRLAVLSVKVEPPARYLILFAFDKLKKNRLVLLDSNAIEEICTYLSAKELVKNDDVLMIVGKDGSKLSHQMNGVFFRTNFRKLVIRDFDGKQGLIDFLREIASDIDRIEARKRALSDPMRTDLTSLPVSDKRIRETPEQEKHVTIFANQLLQINGITEPLALAIAEKYEYPFALMESIAKDDSLDLMTISRKGESKKLNIRVKAGIRKVFDFSANPLDTIR